MEQLLTDNIKPKVECKTLRVEEIATILDIGRSAAYLLAREAESTSHPFKVLRLGNTIRISKKSFDEYLTDNGLL